MKVNKAIIAGAALALSVALSGYAAETPDATAKPKVAVLSGRGAESGKIVEKDGTVRVLTRDQLAFKNSPSPRLLEAIDQRIKKAEEDAKRQEIDRGKLKTKQAEDAKKQAAADATADEKKALEEKEKAEEAAKEKSKALKAYNDKSYEFTGAPYVPPAKKKSPFDTTSSAPPSGAAPSSAPPTETADTQGAADPGATDASKNPPEPDTASSNSTPAKK